MAFEDVEVPVSVKVESAELRRLITEFDGTTESAARLEAQTLKVKSAIDSQRQAIGAFNQANRVQNFQAIESLRLLRSVTSTFSALNQVYQTLALRQIAATQTTVAQQQAFEGTTRFARNLVNGLSILGSENEDVKSGIEDFIAKADQLSSDQIQKLIDAYISAGKEANLSGKELETFNLTLEKLNKLLEETKSEEAKREFESLFGAITAGGTAIGVLGQLALNLSKVEAVMKLFAPGTKAALGGAAIVSLLAIPSVLEALGLERNTESPITGQKIKVETPFDRIDQATGMVQRNEININNPVFNSELDLKKSMDIIEAKLKEKQGLGTVS